ncbi:MAG TPA: DUF4129 domain-containing protein [Blastocatellia bacterium]|nr:DUF4129 domain-containing protein [Blastocatellia bacterium]
MNFRRFKNGWSDSAAESERKIFIRLLLYIALAPSTLYFVPAVSAQGRSTVSDYANRLERAEQAVDEAISQEPPAPRLVVKMNEIKRLAPASEDVEFNGSIIRVDNAWLHEAVDNVIKNAGGDIEQRDSMLTDISDRLARLVQSVKAAQTTQDGKSQDQRARLDNILARPEYQPEEKRESVIGRWIRRIKEFIFRLLGRLFGGSSAPRAGGAWLLTVFRILVVLSVIAALIFGGVKLAKSLQRRERPGKEAKTREALGEELAEDVTADDLFSNACELARQGEYRKAIRRAYIALLCEFEQRGKLRLDRSKTNRDYLDAMRPEQRIYPTFSVMTKAFEHVWYGQERATEDEFREFVALYQEMVK